MQSHTDDSDTHRRTLPALEELQARPQWVCWRKESRHGKLAKVPYNPRIGGCARSDDPGTWASYEIALRANARLSNSKQPYDGLGYMFRRDYTGIDLDHCVSSDGSIDPWALAYLKKLPSYAEYSPTGTGIHILVAGTIPSGTRRAVPGAPHPQAAIEMYCERRYFTITGQHVQGSPLTLEACPQLPVIHAELTAPRPKHHALSNDGQDRSDEARSDDGLLDKAMRAKNGATFRALWEGDSSGYASQSEAELALCTRLSFWTGRDAQWMDRLFRRCALYRPEKWDRPARSGETYGQGTIARAIASCSETYAPLKRGKILQFRRGPIALDDPTEESRVQLPDTDVDFVLECLRDEEEGDARLYAHLFRGKCIYDHSEKMWYEWRGHYWERDECKHALLLASGPLASVYLEASAHLAEQAAQSEKRLDPGLLKDRETDAQQERYQWLKAMIGALIGRAKALKKLARAQAVLTYAQAYLNITAKQWDTNPWLLGTREGVIDLTTGTLCNGRPEQYLRTIIPTAWRGLDEAAPRFAQYLDEIFADREDGERDTLIGFLQRALGYGITGNVSEHIFFMLYGEEGRNGKDTLMTLLQRVLGNTVGAVSNDVIIATGKFSTPGSAKPHLCALQGKRVAWASETSKGARFDVGQVKFLTGGGTIPARQLYGQDYTFDPSHLLILLTNNKPHADANDSAFWDRLCPIIFNVRFVNQPVMPNERQKDRSLGQALEHEASGILAWLVRGCLIWQRDGLGIPPSVIGARKTYRDEEDTLGQFIRACCIVGEQMKVKASRLYERYKEWALENTLKAMNGNTFGLEMKKLYGQKRGNEGNSYCGIGLREEGVGTVYPQRESQTSDKGPSNAPLPMSAEKGSVGTLSPQNGYQTSDEAASNAPLSASNERGSVGSVPTFQKLPYMREDKRERKSSQEVGTLPTPSTSIQEGVHEPVEPPDTVSKSGQKRVHGTTLNPSMQKAINRPVQPSETESKAVKGGYTVATRDEEEWEEFIL